MLPDDDAGPDAFATLIATDGRVLRLVDTGDGALRIAIGGHKPVTLDHYQWVALSCAMADKARG